VPNSTGPRSPGLLDISPYGQLSPDGRYFALSTDRNVLELFDVERSSYIHSFVDLELDSTQGSSSSRHSLAFVHEGRCLLGGGIGKVKMWRLDTKDCVVVLDIGGFTSIASNKVQIDTHSYQ